MIDHKIVQFAFEQKRFSRKIAKNSKTVKNNNKNITSSRETKSRPSIEQTKLYTCKPMHARARVCVCARLCVCVSVCFFIADRFAYICMVSYSSLCANFALGILIYICTCVCMWEVGIICVAGSCTQLYVQHYSVGCFLK